MLAIGFVQPFAEVWMCVEFGAAKRLRVQDQNTNKEKTYAIHDADDPQCLPRQ